MSATRTRICGNHFHAVSAMPGASVICPACGLVFGEAPSGQFESATIQAEKPPPRTLLANPEAEVPKRRSGAVKADAMADVSIAKKRRRWPLFLSLLGVIIIIVLNMAGGLADVVFPEIMMIGGGTTRKEIAPVQVKRLSVTRDLYRVRNGKFPADLKVLTRLRLRPTRHVLVDQ